MVPLLPSPSRVKRVSELIGVQAGKNDRRPPTPPISPVTPLPKFQPFSPRPSPLQVPTVAPRLILRPVLGASRILLRMAPKQATLGYVKPTQTTLGCVEILPANHRTDCTPSIGWSIGDSFADAVPRTASSSVSPMARNRNLLPPSRRSSPLHPSPRHQNQPRMWGPKTKTSLTSLSQRRKRM